MQKLMGLVRRCVDDYHMIEAGDRVGIISRRAGISTLGEVVRK